MSPTPQVSKTYAARTLSPWRGDRCAFCDADAAPVNSRALRLPICKQCDAAIPWRVALECDACRRPHSAHVYGHVMARTFARIPESETRLACSAWPREWRTARLVIA